MPQHTAATQQPRTLDVLQLRRAGPADAACLAVLSAQVFLDTYATQGINADLADEVLQLHTPAALLARLQHAAVTLTMAELHGHLIGFVDMQQGSACPVPGVSGPEVLHLYVQRGFQRQGVGSSLLADAETSARAAGAACVWLTAWVGNARALAFYARQGYADVGSTPYVINGKAYENRVFAKRLAG